MRVRVHTFDVLRDFMCYRTLLSLHARVQLSPNAVNINMIADLYAEVNGVLAQSR